MARESATLSAPSDIEAGGNIAPERGNRWSPTRWYPSLGDRHVRNLWFSLIPSTLAFQMSVVSSGYAALTISGSATAMGLASAASGLPMFLLLMVGGIVADRFTKKTVLWITQAVLCVATASIALLSFAGLLDVWHLVALGLVQGTVFAFGMPARHAFLAELAGPRLLGNAVALQNVGINLCRIVGPAIAGGLLAAPALGIGGVFSVMTLCYLVAMPLLMVLPTQREGSSGALRGSRGNGWHQVLEGLAYIRSSRVLMALIALAFAGSIFGLPFQNLMPLFSERVFEVGAVGLGILMTSLGIGALVGSFAVGLVANAQRLPRIQLIAGLTFGISLLGFALAPAFALAVGLLFIVGATSAAFIALNNTLIMANTDRRFFGRVTSVYGMTFAIFPLAALPMAWVADHVGGPATVAGAAIIVSLAVLLVSRVRTESA
jgi:MFS family permease